MHLPLRYELYYQMEQAGMSPKEYWERLREKLRASGRGCRLCPKYTQYSGNVPCPSYSTCGQEKDSPLPPRPNPRRYKRRCYVCEHCLYIISACYCELEHWPKPLHFNTVKNGESATMRKMLQCPDFQWRQ